DGVSTPYYSDEYVTLYHGKSDDVLSSISGVACVVTSPPYNTLGARVSATGSGKMSGDAWLAKVSAIGYADDMSEANYTAWQADLAMKLATACVPGASFFYNHKVRHRDGVPIH